MTTPLNIKTKVIQKIWCILGFHLWTYPRRYKEINFVEGTHRYCEKCKLEQAHVMFGGWMNCDFDIYK